MYTYEITYEVVGSGAGLVTETIQASSEFSARRLIEAKYSGQTVRILNGRRVE